MMRFARKVALLGVFFLLPSTATVYAECAWVLWQDYSFRHGASLLFRVRLQHEAGGRSAHRPGNQGGL